MDNANEKRANRIGRPHKSLFMDESEKLKKMVRYQLILIGNY